MRTSSISTASLVGTPQVGISRMQKDLVRLNQEVVTSRLADVGLTLGARTSQSVSLHIDNSALSALIDGNSAAAARLQQQQSALDTMRSGADDFMQTLVSAQSSGNSGTIAQAAQVGAGKLHTDRQRLRRSQLPLRRHQLGNRAAGPVRQWPRRGGHGRLHRQVRLSARTIPPPPTSPAPR